MSDFKDIQGGTTSEGIHLGAMAGTIDLIQRCYTGLEFRDDVIWFNPHLPDALKEIAFKIKYRCTWISVYLTKDNLKFSCSGSHNKKTIPIRVKGKRFTLKSGEEKVFEFGRNKVEAV